MKAELVEIIQETPEVRTFRMKPEKKIDFVPGQFIMVTANIRNEKGEDEEVKRPYSISSSPTSDYIDITLNQIPGGKMSTHLFGLQGGETIEIQGPFGVFVWDETKSQKLYTIAGGTGIAPFMSMIRYSVEKGIDNDITLVYSARKPEHVIFNDELEKLAAKSSTFRVFLTITRPDGTGWKGQTGRIDEEFLRKFIKDLDKGLFFLCGPPGFVESIVKVLLAMGIKDDRIKKEGWM